MTTTGNSENFLKGRQKRTRNGALLSYTRNMNERISTLEDELKHAKADRATANERVYRLEKAIDLLMLTTKPNYPTGDQIKGLWLAVEEVKENRIPKSHQHNPGGEGSPVSVDGRRGFIIVAHNAPFSESRRGHRLWGFSDADIKLFIDMLEGWGHKVYDHWTHDIGVSFILKPESVRK